MNIVLLLIVAALNIHIISALAAANSAKSSFRQDEVYSNYGYKVHLSVSKSCLFDGKLNNRKFEHETKMMSPETLKDVPVKVVHLYVRAKHGCTATPDHTEVIEVAGHKKNMTHLYLTVEEPVIIEKVENYPMKK